MRSRARTTSVMSSGFHRLASEDVGDDARLASNARPAFVVDDGRLRLGALARRHPHLRRHRVREAARRLGRVSHMACPGDARAEYDCGAVDDGELVVAGGQRSPLFE